METIVPAMDAERVIVPMHMCVPTDSLFVSELGQPAVRSAGWPVDQQACLSACLPVSLQKNGWAV